MAELGSMPPAQLLSVAAKVEARLDDILTGESQRWNAVDPRLGEVVDELARMVMSGGKRLRAAYCYWTWQALGGQDRASEDPASQNPANRSDEVIGAERVIDIGAAFELLQTFALIHDDIMDDSVIRRNARTIHTVHREKVETLGWRGEARRFGDGVAILVGDLGHVYADQLIGRLNGTVRDLWDELRLELNLGQYLDMQAAASGTHNLDTARRVAMLKSASYTIVRPVQIGAALAFWPDEPDPALLDRLDQFGQPLGLAFQLRDDVLGVLGDPDHLGKPVGDDLREGKPTELVAWAVSKADEAQTKTLATIGDPALTDEQVAEVVQVLHDTGAVARTEAEIGRLLDQSAEALDALPLTDEGQTALAELARFTVARSH